MTRTASTNYSARKTDLFFFQGAALVGNKAITLSFGDVGHVIAGIQKMAQTWALLFLTEEGSVPSAPTLGTRFLMVAGQGGLRDNAEVKQEFALAAKRVKDVMDKAAKQAGSPADETLASATLTQVNLDKAQSLLQLSVTITSKAGGTEDILLPISLAVK
jgi:hypothetical protein